MSARVLAERYELDQRIGKGAMGEIWSAVDLHTGAPVAVKLALRWTSANPELAARFAQESELLGRITSPYICRVLGAGVDGSDPFIVLERLEGETLEELLQREGYLSLLEVDRIGDEILQALVVAHRAGIVHRDLSPSNVILHKGKDGASLTKLVDFGVAKSPLEAPGPSTADGVTMGALAYVAPEQLGGSARVGPRADLYALGTIVFRALTGKLPYGDAQGVPLGVLKIEHDAPTIDEATGETWPAALRTFLGKTLARAPGRRYPSAEVALAAWREAVRGKGPRLTMPEKPPGATTTLGHEESGGPRDSERSRPPRSR